MYRCISAYMAIVVGLVRGYFVVFGLLHAPSAEATLYIPGMLAPIVLLAAGLFALLSRNVLFLAAAWGWELGGLPHLLTRMLMPLPAIPPAWLRQGTYYVAGIHPLEWLTIAMALSGLVLCYLAQRTKRDP